MKPQIGDTIVIPIEEQILRLAKKVNRNRQTLTMSDAEFSRFQRREAAQAKARRKASQLEADPTGESHLRPKG